MTIETERLILRETTQQAFDALYKILADSDIMRHYPYTFDRARVQNWIDKNISRYRVFGFGLWAVCLKQSGEIIGDCGLTMQIIDSDIKPEISYHIAQAHQRRGYAKEAAAACLRRAFEITPFGVIYSYMKAENLASAATARSIGMTFEREFTDAEGEKTAVYSITRKSPVGR